MSPVSLLFSADEENSLQLVQALKGLELEVKPCRDIFTAVEWLTSSSFDVIVADLDSGPEAAFLLKNSRELKLNRTAFTIALTSGTSDLTSEEDVPDLILTKPLISDQVKYAVLSNDRFLTCMKAWVARGDFAQTSGTRRTTERSPRSEQPSPISPVAHSTEPSPAIGHVRFAPTQLTFATLDRKFFRSMSRQSRSRLGSHKSVNHGRNRLVWGTVLSAAFVSAGCIFGEPLQVQSVFASVATAYKQVLEGSSRKPPPTEDAVSPNSVAPVQAVASRHSAKYLPSNGLAPSALPTFPDQVSTIPSETLRDSTQFEHDLLPSADSRVQIPESLKLPQPEISARTTSVKHFPSLLAQLEPVSLPEDLSRELLLQRVQPSYPEQALKAGLQGAVVLQAWIDRDGSIRDLKLVGGSLLLGQAAVKAVKQWRYKPYLRNGVAVEAETYVTVNFKLP
jgi:TonB family protein